MRQSDIILVFGRICSGKSSFQTNAHRIVVSDIVRKLINSNDRSQLQNTQHLDEQIAEEILRQMESYDYLMSHDLLRVHNIVIDGIRQPSIVEYILERFPEAHLIWLDVPQEVRRRRYETRNAEKDTESFDQADNRPIELEGQKIFSIFEDRMEIIYNG
jgi:dephospho-CoA kinase